MSGTEWLLVSGFLAVGGLTFLRLLASVRHALVSQAEAEALARRLAEEARREAETEQEVPVVTGAM